MSGLRQMASILLLITGVTHGAQFLLQGASATNTPVGAAFGLVYFVVGLLLLRSRRLPLWLGAIVPGIGAALAGLLLLANWDAVLAFHVAINLIVFPSCIYLLAQGRSPGGASA